LAQDIKVFGSLSELIEALEIEGIKGLDRIRHIENFLMRKSRLHGRPYCASFELTPLCNFDCKMCYMHLTEAQLEKQGRILTTEEWLDIARQAVDAGVANVDLTGGECLTHPGFEDIYRYLAGRGVRVAVLTNGQLLNEHHIELFKKYPPAGVQISLYGSCPEAYRRVTGRDAFRHVINAIELLKAAGIRIRLSVTPNKYMQDDAESLLDLIYSLNVDYSIGRSTLPARPETGREIKDYIVDNEAFIRMCRYDDQCHTARIDKSGIKPSERYEFMIKGQESFEGVPCSAGAATFHINWKGEMAPCVAYFTVTRSVLNYSLEEAWIWIRDTMKQYREPDECRDCAWHNDCQGCCAEKSAGVLNGPVNPWVCKRMNGLAEIINKGDDKHEACI